MANDEPYAAFAARFPARDGKRHAYPAPAPTFPRSRWKTTTSTSLKDSAHEPGPAARPGGDRTRGSGGFGQVTLGGDADRPVEIVASDTLRSIVGSGPADLEATTEAFALLDQIVAARTRRSLTTVIDTLGLDPDRRDRYRQLARSSGLPAVLVIIDAPRPWPDSATATATVRCRRW